MSLNSTERFTSRVADYVRYRPDYPVALVEWLHRELGVDRADGHGLGTLSGGGTERVSVGERSLVGAEAGVGIALGAVFAVGVAPFAIGVISQYPALSGSLAAYAILKLFKRSNTTALTVAASLAQIGEFSFILAGLGVDLQILPREGRDLILAVAIISIMLNPFIFAWATRTPKPAPARLARGPARRRHRRRPGRRAPPRPTRRRANARLPRLRL